MREKNQKKATSVGQEYLSVKTSHTNNTQCQSSQQSPDYVRVRKTFFSLTQKVEKSPHIKKATPKSGVNLREEISENPGAQN